MTPIAAAVKRHYTEHLAVPWQETVHMHPLYTNGAACVSLGTALEEEQGWTAHLLAHRDQQVRRTREVSYHNILPYRARIEHLINIYLYNIITCR
jgi:hypothetical protein